MRRRFLFQLAFPVVILSATAVVCQEPRATAKVPLTADKILDRYVEAIGGQAVQDGISTRWSRGFSLNQDGKRTEWESYSSDHGRKSLSIRHESAEEIRTGFDGKNLWVQHGRGKARFMHGESEYERQSAVGFANVAHWRDWVQKVELWGTAEVMDRKTHVVRLLPRKGRAFQMYIDDDSFLLLREDSTFPAFGGFDPAERYYSDYRDVGGIKVPFRIDTVYHVTALQRFTRRYSTFTTEVRLNLLLDGNMFEKPK